MNGLKKRLKRAKGNWVEELLNVLWAYRTRPRRLTGEIPLSIMYRAEAITPIEISLSSMRVVNFLRSNNDTRMVKNLDSLEERRDMASI